VFFATVVASAFVLPGWAPLVVGVVGLVLLIRWHARTFGHRCPSCGAEFVLRPLQDALAFNGVSQGHAARRVRCPSCGERRFMRVLVVRR
jgi:DNA-directed RNA polymerase subunit RPC12/RpoP